jgi:hypothetical protein
VLIRFGLFDRVQVSPLDVFDQCQFKQLLIGRMPDHDRNCF